MSDEAPSDSAPALDPPPRLREPTWEALEGVCAALAGMEGAPPLDADAVVGGQVLQGHVTAREADAGRRARLAEACCTNAGAFGFSELPARAQAVVCRRLVDAFAEELRAELAGVQRHIERLKEAHPGVLEGSSGGGVSLGLQLAGLDAGDYDLAVCRWPVGRMLRWLMSRAVKGEIDDLRDATGAAADAMKKRL